MAINVGNPWAFGAGVIGNIISFMVFLAPVPTFYKIYKRKSTELYHSVAYVVALFSAMIWLYFALLKMDVFLITINSFGCLTESVYIAIFLIFAPKSSRASTIKLLLSLNFGIFGMILLLTLVFTDGDARTSTLGWIGSAFSVGVFVSPLSVIMLVIRTRSVEYMPFALSLFLTLNAVAWFTYGLLRKDMFVALPNVLGFIFGMFQMGLFLAFKKGSGSVTNQDLPKLQPSGLELVDEHNNLPTDAVKKQDESSTEGQKKELEQGCNNV